MAVGSHVKVRVHGVAEAGLVENGAEHAVARMRHQLILIVVCALVACLGHLYARVPGEVCVSHKR